MTEPLITVSPKTSPYRSQIRSRVASPGSLTPIKLCVSPLNHRTADHPLLSSEKSELRKLNDQFLSYIERIRLFETYNNCLTTHCEHIKNAQERTRNKSDLLKKEFEEYQNERLGRETKDVELENEHTDDLDKQVIEYKAKKNFFQHEHELNQEQIIDMQKQAVDIQAKTEQLRFDHENSTDENNHCRRQIAYYQMFKSSILDEITHQRNVQQRLQLEVDDLKAQKQLTIQACEADIQAIEIQNDNILYDLKSNFRIDGNGKGILSQTLNEIREEYKIKNNEMREELHRKYLIEYNRHVKKQMDQNLVDINRDNLERHHLTNELNALHDQKLLFRQKLALMQEHYKQLENNIQRETKRQKDMQEKYDHEIKKLTFSVNEYESLLVDSSSIRPATLDGEVKKYRQLLEGLDQQTGLRQIVNTPSTIDRFRSVSPSLITTTESTPIVQLTTSRTRQNSTSENSYATAPGTTTNQLYLTLESISKKLLPNDNDTENDLSQTIQNTSGRSSRLISETDIPSTGQDSLVIIDTPKLDETMIDITIDTPHTESPINQTLPFVPMIVTPSDDTDEIKTILPDENQSPLISTLEQREEIEKFGVDVAIPISSEITIPITIDIKSKLSDELNEAKILSPCSSITHIEESNKPALSPTTSSPNQPETELPTVEVPVSTLPKENPLAKLISTMLPDAAPFVPSSTLNDQPIITQIPISTMNNDAPPFIPGQQGNHQQQHMMNTGGGQWNGNHTRGGGMGNRRGQNIGGFHHGGGQRAGGGNNWQQGGGHHKQRRGPK